MAVLFESTLQYLLRSGASLPEIVREINLSPLRVRGIQLRPGGASETLFSNRFIQEGVRYITQQLNFLHHLDLRWTLPDTTPLKLLGASMLGAKAFLGLNVSAVVASGSTAAIGVASAFVAGAGAAGYGIGTLVDRTFNLSDRLADGLFNIFH